MERRPFDVGPCVDGALCDKSPSPSRARPTRNGKVPDSPLDKRKSKTRRVGDLAARAETCEEFGENPDQYRSIDVFISAVRERGGIDGWYPSKGQMSRDMRRLFGDDWTRKRGRGGRARADGASNAKTAPGLITPIQAALLLEPNRTPTALSSLMEYRVVESIRDFEKRFGTGIVTPILIQSLAIHEVLSQLPELQSEDDVNSLLLLGSTQNRVSVVMRQLASVSRKTWLRSFLTRHKSIVRKIRPYRSLERHKAAKHQIELVLCHLRNVYQAEALIQIQRHIARAGQQIPGFERFKGIIMQSQSASSDCQDSLIEVRGKELYVTVLNEPLEHVSAELRYALDETLIVPDSPLLKTYTTLNRIPISRGRAAIWTLLPVFCANGSLISSMLLQRCQSLPVDIVKFTSSNDICAGATENAQQTDETWLKFAEVWLPLCNGSCENPGVIYIDGHSCHITRAFIELAAEQNLYVIVEPSHTSVILQVPDVGISRFIKDQYAREYTAGVCASNVTGRIFDDFERI